jgi:hypothetical protein
LCVHVYRVEILVSFYFTLTGEIFGYCCIETKTFKAVPDTGNLNCNSVSYNFAYSFPLLLNSVRIVIGIAASEVILCVKSSKIST